MRDVEWLLKNGTYRVKALTPRAREAMGQALGGPWQMAAEVFWDRIDPARFPATLEKLKALGLSTGDDDERPWEF